MIVGLRLPSVAPVAAIAATAVFVTSAGDASVGVVLLLVALGPVAGAAALGALVATVARWGTADLGVVAGDQAVLGAAVAVGPAAAAVSSALAAIALLLVARPITVEAGASRAGVLVGAMPCGLGAAALAAGPATTSAADIVVRVIASVVGVVLAVAVAMRRPAGARFDLAAVGAGALAAVLAVLA